MNKLYYTTDVGLLVKSDEFYVLLHCSSTYSWLRCIAYCCQL